jgi:hypothetical protein
VRGPQSRPAGAVDRLQRMIGLPALNDSERAIVRHIMRSDDAESAGRAPGVIARRARVTLSEVFRLSGAGPDPKKPSGQSVPERDLDV